MHDRNPRKDRTTSHRVTAQMREKLLAIINKEMGTPEQVRNLREALIAATEGKE